MTVESATYIDDLNAAYPLGTDPKSEGDDHIRLIKSTLKTTFPNVTGAVTPTHTELNYVDGVTSAIQTQINTINSQLATTLFPNVTGTVTPTHTELNYVDGVTSAIQTQLDARLKTTLSGNTTVSGGTYTLTIDANVASMDNAWAWSQCLLSMGRSTGTYWAYMTGGAFYNTVVLGFSEVNHGTFATTDTIDFLLGPVQNGTLQGNTTFTLTISDDSTLGANHGAFMAAGPCVAKIIVFGHASSAYTTAFDAGSGFTRIWEGGSAPGALPAGDIRIVDVLIKDDVFYLSYKDYPA